MMFKAIHVSSRVAAWSVLATALVASAAAQGRPDIRRDDQTIKFPVLSETVGPRAVVESTSKFWPPIVETYTPIRRVPKNPGFKRPNPNFLDNGLRAGQVLPVKRIDDMKSMFPGIDMTGYDPPDPTIAVGPNHVVATVNSSLAFYNKNTGQRLFQQGAEGSSGFFGSVGAGTFVFDPKVFYDQVSQRFFMVFLDLDEGAKTSNLLIAVSDDQDPMGTWYKWKIDNEMNVGGTEMWFDYPGWGYNKDFVICAGDMIAYDGSAIAGQQFIAMSKSQMLTGGSPSIFKFNDQQSWAAQIAEMQSPTSNVIYGGTTLIDFASPNSVVRMYAFSTTPSTISMVARDVPVPPYFNATRFLAESAGGRLLDTLFGQLQNAVWRDGKFYAAHTTTNATESETYIRWYAIDTSDWPITGTPSLWQSGEVRTPGSYNFMPAIGVSGNGDVSLLYTKSNSGIVADMMLAGRRANDPLGTMSDPIVLKSSSGTTYGWPGFNRWGDYFMITTDPEDDQVFWGVGQVGKTSGDWTTEIFTWKISDAAGFDFVDFAPYNMGMYFGRGINGSVGDAAASEDIFVRVASRSGGRVGQVAGVEFDYKFDGHDLAGLQALQVRVEANGPTGTTMMMYLWDYNSNRYVHIKSSPLRPTDDNEVIYQNKADFARFVSGTGDVKVLVRAVRPYRQQGRVLPAPYTLEVDQAIVGGGFASGS